MIKIICVGKKHDELFAAAIEHYEKRIRRLCTMEWYICPHGQGDESAVRSEESLKILDKLPLSAFVVLFDERGKNFTNHNLAQYIQNAQNSSRDIVIIIGGSYGVSDAVRARANYVLAFGSSVFPHQLIRIMVVEQLYRSLSLLAGSKYHHE